jgi:dihydrofolate reductase
MKTIVVAHDQKNGIGASNDLLWQRDLPADLKHFKEVTLGHTVVMGRKTYESIGRPLPNRQNIVVTSSPEPIEGVRIARSLLEAYSLAGDDVYIIGGGQIYATSIGDADRIIATEVCAVFSQATVFFPVLDISEWREVSREHHEPDERNMYPYDFVIYERIAK